MISYAHEVVGFVWSLIAPFAVYCSDAPAKDTPAVTDTATTKTAGDAAATETKPEPAAAPAGEATPAVDSAGDKN